MKVTVKTLSGEKICLQMGGEQLVGDVVAAVLRQQSSLQSCTLFLRGTSLCSDQRLGTLPLQPTDFLCAVGTRKGKRKQKPMVATNRHIPEANLAHAQPIPDALLEPHRCCTPEPPACSLSMPTGYEGNCQVPGRGAFGSNEAPDGEHRSESRLLNENLGQGPNECTRKRCQVDLWEELNVELSECQIAKTPVATEKQISELECVSGTKSGCPDNKVSDTSYPAGLSEQQFVPKLKKQRIGKELESNAAGGSSSQDGTVYPASLPLPPSLKRLESIFGVLNGLSGFLLRTHIQPTWLNVRAALRDVCQDQSISDGDILAMAELCSTIISVRWGGSAKALRPKDPWDTATTTELSPGSRLPRVPGADVRLEDLRSWFADIRDGYGTVLEGDIRTLIVELNTPMRSSGHTKQNQKGAQELLGNFLCTPGESAPHRSYGSNVRRRTFHQRLVQVVGQIHEDFLRGSDVLLRSTAIREAAPHSGTSGATGDERSHFDPVEEGRWHPQFCLEAVTVRAAVQAAKKLEKLGKAKTDGNGPKRPPSLLKRHIPCTDSRPLDACAFLEHIMQLTWYSDQIVHTESMPARSAVFAKTRTRLSDHVLQALEAQGVRRLFSHQSQAIDAATTGDHVVVSTSTASGKSLCYNIPILQALVDDPAACALYMYPTKALAQDQLRALRQLCMKAAGLHTIQAEIYDGDTPFESRAGICANANLLITNPDMLHLSILPVHTQFARLLSRLRFVVIDEGHAYKGAFGCHTAMVLRRLRRVCERVHGNTPTFIMTSATVPNAKEHMERLAGVQGVVEVSHDGSPSGPKHVSLWNPSLVDSKGKPSKQKDAKLEWERMSKQQQRKILRAQIREANQERSRGSQFVAARGMSEADWLAAVAIGKKRAQQSSSGVKTGVTVSASGRSGKKLPRSQLAGISSGPSGANSCDTSSVCQRDNQRAGQDDVTELHSDCAEPGGPSYECDRRGKDLSTGGKEAPARDSNCDAEALAARVVGGNLASSSAAPDPTETSADRRLLSVEGSTCLENVVCTSAPHPRRQMMWKGTRGKQVTGEKPEIQEEIQSRLPGPEWKAHYGTSGIAPDKRRGSPIVEMSLLLAECIQHGLRTIAFCNTRKLCELVTAYTRETLRCTAPHLADSLCVYRAGYRPEERRQIEAQLFGGQLRAVAATNALELGVDVGSLDVTLHMGFPGSVASLWQQAGRAGRREQVSLSIVLAFDSPLDQYFMRHPEQLFGRSIEHVQIDANNANVLQEHLACAAHELPLDEQVDVDFFGGALPAAIERLREIGQISRPARAELGQGQWLYSGRSAHPASGVSLRAIDPERFAIVNDASDEQIIEEIEESKAFYEIYDGAVYMFQGRTYLCTKLDLVKKVAHVRPADLKYYTKTRDFLDVHVIGSRIAYTMGPAAEAYPKTSASCAEALVTARWIGFHRIWQGSNVIFDTVDLFLPDAQFDTQAAYIRVPHSARKEVHQRGLPWREGLHGAGHALLNVIPLFMMCGPRDMATECDYPQAMRFRPERILVYDNNPGGIGLAKTAAPLFGVLLDRAYKLVAECPCEEPTGCPGCVQHPACPEYNVVLCKASALVILGAVLRAERHPDYMSGVREDGEGSCACGGSPGGAGSH